MLMPCAMTAIVYRSSDHKLTFDQRRKTWPNMKLFRSSISLMPVSNIQPMAAKKGE
jgi:hypothetical protein